MRSIEQPALPMRIAVQDCNVAEVAALPSFQRVMEYTLQRGPFDNDKDAARQLRIDPALFSRRRNGDAPWSVQDVNNVMVVCQSLAPLVWLARQMGHDLVMRETEAERQLNAMRLQLEKERDERRVVEEAMRRMLVGKLA